MLDTFRKEIPLLADYQPDKDVVPTNSQVFRVYVERYLTSLPVVNQDLDLLSANFNPRNMVIPIRFISSPE